MAKQRELFVSIIKQALLDHPDTILLLGDISTYAFRDSPRVVNCGCGEQAMVGIAAGLALEGWYPIVHSIAGFILRRAYEQIAVDFGAQGLSGLFIGLNNYKGLGYTHNCPEWNMLRYYAGMENIYNSQDVYIPLMKTRRHPYYWNIDAND